MKLYFIILFCFLILLGTTTDIYAQAKQDKYGNEFFEGGFTDPSSEFPVNPTQKQPTLTILKYDNRGVLIGNECVHEETVKMGFEYLVLCDPKATFWNKVWVSCYNFSTNVELTFRNGFGWKGRLKKKIVECRRNSGDFVW